MTFPNHDVEDLEGLLVESFDAGETEMRSWGVARIGAFGLFNPISVAVRGIETCPLGLSPLPRSDLIDNVNFILERRVVDNLGQWSTLLTELVYDLQRVGR